MKYLQTVSSRWREVLMNHRDRRCARSKRHGILRMGMIQVGKIERFAVRQPGHAKQMAAKSASRTREKGNMQGLGLPRFDPYS
jgi:hypothetical protein